MKLRNRFVDLTVTKRQDDGFTLEVTDSVGKTIAGNKIEHGVNELAAMVRLNTCLMRAADGRPDMIVRVDCKSVLALLQAVGYDYYTWTLHAPFDRDEEGRLLITHRITIRKEGAPGVPAPRPDLRQVG